MTFTLTAPAAPSGEPVGWFEPGSPDWHAARKNGIGGSEIAAVLGLSPYESAFSLWHRKRGLIEPVDESPEMYWGKRLEAPICDEWATRNPAWQVLPSPTYRGTGRPWQIANPDRLLHGPDGEFELLEAKTSRDDTYWGEEGTDEVPVHYKAQCRWYLDTLALHRCRIAVLIAGSDWREYIVEHDQDDALVMRDAAHGFMRTVHDGIRPSIDGHNATYSAIKQLPDSVDDVDVDITPDLRDRYFAALDACKAAEEEKRHAAGLVLDLIDTGRRAVVGPQKVATRICRPDGTTKALQPARNRGNPA